MKVVPCLFVSPLFLLTLVSLPASRPLISPLPPSFHFLLPFFLSLSSVLQLPCSLVFPLCVESKEL